MLVGKVFGGNVNDVCEKLILLNGDHCERNYVVKLDRFLLKTGHVNLNNICINLIVSNALVWHFVGGHS